MLVTEIKFQPNSNPFKSLHAILSISISLTQLPIFKKKSKPDHHTDLSTPFFFAWTTNVVTVSFLSFSYWREGGNRSKFLAKIWCNLAITLSPP
jgi:hypothetical protein